MSFQTKIGVSALKTYYLNKDSPCIGNWIITNQCNAKCPFCEIGTGDVPYVHKEELSTERCFELIEEMKDLGIKVMTISGGEAFMRKDIFLVLNQ